MSRPVSGTLLALLLAAAIMLLLAGDAQGGSAHAAPMKQETVGVHFCAVC